MLSEINNYMILVDWDWRNLYMDLHSRPYLRTCTQCPDLPTLWNGKYGEKYLPREKIVNGIEYRVPCLYIGPPYYLAKSSAPEKFRRRSKFCDNFMAYTVIIFINSTSTYTTFTHHREGRLGSAVAAMTCFLVPTCFYKVALAGKLFPAALAIFRGYLQWKFPWKI